MELKTYQARSMHDALTRVKNDMGRDAVILHTRTIKRGGLFGIGSKSVVEVTASNDPRLSEMRAAANNQDEKDPPRPRPLPNPVIQEAYGKSKISPPARSGETISEALESETTQSPSQVCGTGVSPVSPRLGRRYHRGAGAVLTQSEVVFNACDSEATGVQVDSSLRREIDDIRSMVENLLRRAEREQLPKLPEELIEYYSHLIGQDVAEELALELVQRLSRQWLHRSAGGDAAEATGEPDHAVTDDRGDAAPNDGNHSPCGARVSPVREHRGDACATDSASASASASAAAEGDAAQHAWIQNELRQAVCEMLPPAEPLRMADKDGPMIVAMVGPTGVGKTTTIAKLAATMRLREGKRVGMITIDSYRIAAVEQLKTYARILDVPLVPVVTSEEMQKAVRQLSDVDLILIDTAGRSPRDEPHITELAEFLAAASPDQVHLVLSTTSRESAIREAIENFSSLGAKHLVFTKLDEAVGLGVMLNVLNSVDMRLSYLTNGQAVPSDIEEGSAKRVAQLILGKDSERASAEQPDSRGEESAHGLVATASGSFASAGGLVA